jgi:hypothetical protein
VSPVQAASPAPDLPDEAEAVDVAVIADAPPSPENAWPSAGEEAAYLAEANGRGEPTVATVRPTSEEIDDAPKKLPALDELVARIPADVRETLEELFRARFVTVKRVPKKALKTE